MGISHTSKINVWWIPSHKTSRITCYVSLTVYQGRNLWFNCNIPMAITALDTAYLTSMEYHGIANVWKHQWSLSVSNWKNVDYTTVGFTLQVDYLVAITQASLFSNNQFSWIMIFLLGHPIFVGESMSMLEGNNTSDQFQFTFTSCKNSTHLYTCSTNNL